MAGLLLGISVTVTLLQIVTGQNVVDCPNPVDCIDNPCNTASCPNFIEAVCSPNYCSGECRATFLLGKDQRDVTDRCEIPSCETHICPASRPVCVEERVPCPRNRTTCIPSKQVKLSCEKIAVSLPSDCSMVRCATDQTCSVEQRAEGSVALCVERIPEHCDELECEPGRICRERDKDGVITAICVPERLEDEDCSTVVCSTNDVCQLTGAGRPRCVAKPPPQNCEELMCDEGFTCVLRNERRAICVQLNPPEPTRSLIQELVSANVIGKQCSDIHCVQGYHCIMYGDIDLFGSVLIPRCVPNTCPHSRPPLTCQELVCGQEEYCAISPSEDGPSRPYCIPYGMQLSIIISIIQNDNF